MPVEDPYSCPVPLRKLQTHRPRTQILLPWCALPSVVWCQRVDVFAGAAPGGCHYDSCNQFKYANPKRGTL